MSTTPEPDCGSSSCIFSANGGMRTNGPCRCYENAGFHGSAVMAAKQMLREVLILRAKLNAAPRWIKVSDWLPHVGQLVVGADKQKPCAPYHAHLLPGPEGPKLIRHGWPMTLRCTP